MSDITDTWFSSTIPDGNDYNGTHAEVMGRRVMAYDDSYGCAADPVEAIVSDVVGEGKKRMFLVTRDDGTSFLAREVRGI